MAAIGVSTASLFKNALTPGATNPNAVTPVNPQELANIEAAARAKAEGEALTQAPASKLKAPVEPTFFEEKPDDEQQGSGATQAEQTSESNQEGGDPDSEAGELAEASVENFKRLRGVYKETKKSLKTLEAEKRAAEEKLKTYVPPEILQEKEARIAELSHWEKIHNLKSSKEYQQKYAKPLNEAHDKLKGILKDYGVPAEDVDNLVKHATGLSNTAELNSFLSNNFSDQLGASEAKQLITNIRTLENEARTAEKEPERVMQSLQESTAALMAEQEVARRDTVVRTAKSAFQEVMNDIVKEGQVKELIPVDDDPEFNEHYVDKLRGQAAKEYGKVITQMAKDGFTPSKELAKALAKMTALSQVAGVSITTRDWALERAKTLEQNVERDRGMYRPNIGGGSPSRAPMDAGAPPKPIDPQVELQRSTTELLNKIRGAR